MALAHFTDSDVRAAFPEFTVEVPNVGHGVDKVAYRVARSGDVLALKILTEPTEDDADEFDESLATERFRRELRGMSDLECPHIIRVVDEPQVRQIASSNHIWYTEPFLTGGTLHERLKGSGRLDGAEAHALAHALLTAVDVMWTQGNFVHRDIKPKNIGYSSAGLPVLLDLGIALFVDESAITQSSLSSPGSQYYAAPEQYEARRDAIIDFRTDLFQVGIVLAEALTGAHPFRGSGGDYMTALRSFDASTLDGVSMPDGLRRTIPRLLAAHPSRRFRTVELAMKSLGGDA